MNKSKTDHQLRIGDRIGTATQREVHEEVYFLSPRVKVSRTSTSKWRNKFQIIDHRSSYAFELNSAGLAHHAPHVACGSFAQSKGNLMPMPMKLHHVLNNSTLVLDSRVDVDFDQLA